MNLSNVKPATLAPEQRAKWRAALCAEADESRVEQLAAQLWSDAVDAGDFDKARAIAEETATWFTDEGE
jgi:predicted dinucleotide-binding enzyme